MQRLRGEQAATTSEYVGLVVLVAALVGALIVNNPAGLGTAVQGVVEAAFCRVVAVVDGGECATDDDGPATVDEVAFRPDRCDIRSRMVSGQVALDVLIFDVSVDVKLARVRRSDGTTEFTILDGGGAGVGLEAPGVAGSAGVASVEVGAGVGVDAKFQVGNSWVVPTAEADDFQRQLIEEALEFVGRPSVPLGVGKFVDDHLVDRWNGGIRDPDITFRAGGAGTYAKATANAKILGEEVGGAEVGGDVGVLLGTEDNRMGEPPEWTTTEYREVSASVAARLGVLTAGVERSYDRTMILEIERNARGQLRSITLVRETQDSGLQGQIATKMGDGESVLAAADGRSVVRTAELETTSTEDRALAERWLEDRDAAEFAQLMRDRAKVTVAEYQGGGMGLSLGAKVSLAIKLGAEGSLDYADSNVVEAYYYGAPDTSGRRQLVPFEECVLYARN